MAQSSRKIIGIGAAALVAIVVIAGIALTGGSDNGQAGNEAAEGTQTAANQSAQTSQSGQAQSQAQSTQAQSTQAQSTKSQSAQAGTQSSGGIAIPEDVPALPGGMTEMVMGDPDAPVTMVEFASMTCSHCRAFHMNKLPELKKKYIDTGKLRYILRDFPLDGLALRASMAARCAGPDQYFAYVDRIFQRQGQWRRAEDPIQGLAKIFKLGGMSQSEFDACLKNKELGQNIVQASQTASKALSIKATPSFWLAGQTFSGNQPMDKFVSIIENALPAGEDAQ